MYAFFFLIIVFAYVKTNALVVPWDHGMYVCEKWRYSHYAHSPVDPMWRYRLDNEGELVLRNESTGLLITNRTDCINQCDKNEKCVAISFRNDNRCIMMTQCLLTRKRSDYSYYYKKGFNNGHNYTINFGHYCKSHYPPLIAHIRPATVPECWEECMRQDGCNHVEIDETLECKLYNECEVVMNDYGHLRRGMVISNSTLFTTRPTMSPTPEPTPVNNLSTPAPSSTPTVSPTGSPTGSPNTSAPTESPTMSPTVKPTPLITRPPSNNSPSGGASNSVNDGDNGRALSDGAIIGIAIGILILILLIILAVIYFKQK